MRNLKRAIIFTAEALIALLLAALLFTYSAPSTPPTTAVWRAKLAAEDVASAIAQTSLENDSPDLRSVLDNAHSVIGAFCFKANTLNASYPTPNARYETANCAENDAGNGKNANSVKATRLLYDGDNFYELEVTAEWN